MPSMTDDWTQFSKAVKAHIDESGKKYKFNDNIELANMLPWEWALGDATKYMFEILRWVNQGLLNKFAHPREVMMENLLKAAHCAQIAYTKLSQIQDGEDKIPMPGQEYAQ